MEGVNGVERAVMACIRNRFRTHGRVPSNLMIAQRLGFASQTSVQRIVKSLCARGILERETHGWRLVKLPHEFPLEMIPAQGKSNNGCGEQRANQGPL